MAKRRGRWTRKWAEGPGRQSGAWALSAAAVAGIHALNYIRAECPASEPQCEIIWQRLFFLPGLLVMPAILATFVLLGSWWAQRRHLKFDAQFYENLESAELPEIPPGHHKPAALERDLIWRTMRGVSVGAMLSVTVFGLMGATEMGLRACDPVKFSQPTGLPACSGPVQWSDAIVAFEIWTFMIVAILWSITIGIKSRRFKAPKQRRKRIPGFGKSKRESVSQAHP